MRPILLITAILCTTFLSAQEFDKNVMFNINGGLSSSLNDVEQVGLSFRVATTNKKKLAIGFDFGYLRSQINRASFEIIDVGPFFRIYLLGLGRSGPFIGAEASYGSFYEEVKAGNGTRKSGGSAFLYGPDLGLNFNLNETVAFEVLVHLQKAVSQDTGVSSDWGMIMEVGTIIFL